ncbi:serine/threonine protein phosphatase 2a 57 kda regulatory subunit b' beta isoform [Quercus suber]|uniref:Serine/threonine protein phosphatase 2a 57 kDa regulatory subunit b' beta isoform n=1 Tax=Quercus suber TaxID=58331 RepID=A0AAW0JRZ4_QUESU
MKRIKHGSITSRLSFSNSINEDILSIISHCTFIFTFTDPLESPSKQDLKRVKLTQLLSILKSSKKLQDQILAPLMSMLSTNLFRPLPPPSNPSISSNLIDDEDSISSFPPTWSHLQIVYDILLRLVINMDPETLRDYVNHPFLLNLLSLFRSEDPRERESLKNVYHRIYSRFIFYRSFMRKSMNDVFLHYIFEKERHCGIGDLLEIWGTLINGFTVPLKEEHKLFLMRVLIPLHKTKGMHTYHRQLAYCVSQFVAERALYVWNNEHFVKMATLEIEEVFPIVVEGVERNLKWHWSKSVRQFTETIKEMLEDLDSALYSKCLQEIDLREYRAGQEEIKRREKWERIEMAAKKN